MEVLWSKWKSYSKKSKKPKVIIYTFCWNALSGVPGVISVGSKIQKKCRTILNRYFDDMFSCYLHMHGVKEYYDIVFSGGIRKMYGYFYYNPENDLTKQNK